jgi:hypothetical protein
MNIVRSVLGVVIGCIVAVVIITAIQAINFVQYKPADAPGLDDMKKLSEWMEALQKDPQKMSAWFQTLPVAALVVVLCSWQLGAFLGGAVSALIAGRARLLHAGIIGAVVLVSTIYNFYDMKNRYDIAHPDWMIVAGLLLPLPVSLLAGKLVSMLFPPTVPPASAP